jgi:nucleoside-diphosphate kinase
MERTLVLVKPDAMQRGLAGEILARLERRGLRIAGLKLMQVDRALAEATTASTPARPSTKGWWATSCRVPLRRQSGRHGRGGGGILGKTNPRDATPGTIRGDFGLEIGRNLIHGSDSLASAEREVGLFFNANEIQSYSRDVDKWVFE